LKVGYLPFATKAIRRKLYEEKVEGKFWLGKGIRGETISCAGLGEREVTENS
jgi:hypothetical protein